MNFLRAKYDRTFLWILLAERPKTSVLRASNSAIWPARKNNLVFPICKLQRVIQISILIKARTKEAATCPDEDGDIALHLLFLLLTIPMMQRLNIQGYTWHIFEELQILFSWHQDSTSIVSVEIEPIS